MRQVTVLFTAFLVLWMAFAIRDAAQGDTSALKVAPIVVILMGGGLWIVYLSARLRCTALGITNPRTYLRDQTE